MEVDIVKSEDGIITVKTYIKEHNSLPFTIQNLY